MPSQGYSSVINLCRSSKFFPIHVRVTWKSCKTLSALPLDTCTLPSPEIPQRGFGGRPLLIRTQSLQEAEDGYKQDLHVQTQISFVSGAMTGLVPGCGWPLGPAEPRGGNIGAKNLFRGGGWELHAR